MNFREQVNFIFDANSSFRALEEINDDFLKHLVNHSTATDVSSQILVKDKNLTVPCYGLFVIAVPRTIRDKEGSFYIEYIFYSGQDEEKKEVWRFYLDRYSELIDCPGKERICTSTNTKIANYICMPILKNAIQTLLEQTPITK